jgi:outer membrane protein assembly factor BamB
VYATRAATGEQLWSAPVPGKVEDLAVHGGRLFVLCERGEIVCFSAPLIR